jgi:hypothetical protein
MRKYSLAPRSIHDCVFLRKSRNLKNVAFATRVSSAIWDKAETRSSLISLSAVHQFKGKLPSTILSVPCRVIGLDFFLALEAEELVAKDTIYVTEK